MKSIRVQVELPDLQKDNHLANSCPIHDAIMRHGIYAFVNTKIITIREEILRGWFKIIKYSYYNTPPLISDWIEVYDRNEGVLPIDFELNLDNPISIKEIVS